MRIHLALLAATLLAAAPTAFASKPDATVGGYLGSTNAMVEEARTITRMERDDRDAIEDAQAMIVQLLDGHADLAELDATDRARLDEEHGRIAFLLKRNEGKKMICTNVVVTGTRHSKRECMTKEKRDERLAAGREGVRDVQRMDCARGEGKSCGFDEAAYRNGGL